MRKPKISRLTPCFDLYGLSGILTEILSADIQSGTLKEYSLGDLMRLNQFRKKTGIVHLIQKDEKVDIHFLQGELMDVHWLSRPGQKKLLSLLIQNDIINKEQAERCIQRQKDTGQKIGYLLLHMGLLSQETLAGYIKLHIIEGLRVAMQLHEGNFLFEKQPVSHFEKPSYHPFKVSQIFEDMIIGRENLPYLQKKIYDTIIESGMENLFLMPSGPIPPKPSEILGSARMPFLLSFLKDRFDVLVIDSPPVLPISDPLLLAPLADGIIFVVKAGLLDRKIIQKALENLKTTRANILGLVLNQVDFKKDTYYHYYSKYYGKK
jgi:capsular exopolysaccharide synthesis family protein